MHNSVQHNHYCDIHVHAHNLIIFIKLCMEKGMYGHNIMWPDHTRVGNGSINYTDMYIIRKTGFSNKPYVQLCLSVCTEWTSVCRLAYVSMRPFKQTNWTVWYPSLFTGFGCYAQWGAYVYKTEVRLNASLYMREHTEHRCCVHTALFTRFRRVGDQREVITAHTYIQNIKTI